MRATLLALLAVVLMGAAWDSVGNAPTKLLTWKSYSHGNAGSTGSHYLAGFYFAPATDANLSQASATVNLGAANVPYAAHAFLVAGGAGTADAGTVSVVVSGTSITDGGVRTGSDTETIVADITALSANEFVETSKKWIGQVVYTLTPSGAATYALDFNYGFNKYEDFGNRAFVLSDFECVGAAGANDAGFDIEIIQQKATGWTYHATAFVAGAAASYVMTTIHGAESDLDNGEPFAFKRAGLNVMVDGADSEGVVIRTTTSAANAIEALDCHLGVTF